MKCLICGKNEVEEFMRPGGRHILSGQGACYICAQKELLYRGIISMEEYQKSV